MAKDNIVAVYIRSLAFKCAAGSRREQVLLSLKKKDEAVQINVGLIVVACLMIGFCSGLALAQMGII